MPIDPSLIQSIMARVGKSAQPVSDQGEPWQNLIQHLPQMRQQTISDFAAKQNMSNHDMRTWILQMMGSGIIPVAPDMEKIIK